MIGTHPEPGVAPPPRIASQLPDHLHAIFVDVLPALDFMRLPIGFPRVPDEVEVLIALPFTRDRKLPPAAPSWWPGGLRWIQLVTVGLDFYPDWYLYDVPAATSGRGRSAIAMAEFALAAILGAAKRLPDIWLDSPGKWHRDTLGTVAGTTLGLFGYGHLAKELVPRAQALGMRVIAIRRSDQPMDDNVERVASIAELFARSDHVVLAAPGTHETVHIVDRGVLEGSKRGLHLINVARGSLIDDDALIAALDRGWLALATLDTTVPEPLPAGHAFYTHPKVRLSPHIATNTLDNFRGLAERFAENMSRYRTGRTLLDLITKA